MARKKEIASIQKVEMKEWISLAELIKESGRELKMRVEDPLEGYIYTVQDAFRRKMDPFEEKFAKGACILFNALKEERLG